MSEESEPYTGSVLKVDIESGKAVQIFDVIISRSWQATIPNHVTLQTVPFAEGRQRVIDELLSRLGDLSHEDPETAHTTADALLLEFIGSPEVQAAFDAVPKWYS